MIQLLAEIAPLEDKVFNAIKENWWIFALIGVLIIIKIVSLFRK